MKDEQKEKNKNVGKMIRIEEMDISTQELFEGSISRLREMMYKNPLELQHDSKYFRSILWKFNHTPSDNDLEALILFLNRLEIIQKDKKDSFFHFRHDEIPIHINVIPETEGFIINAHIDRKPHTDVVFSKFTSKLLSELSFFLQAFNKQTLIIFDKKSYPITQEHKEIKENKKKEPVEKKRSHPISSKTDKGSITRVKVRKNINTTKRIKRNRKVNSKNVINYELEKNQPSKKPTYYLGKKKQRKNLLDQKLRNYNRFSESWESESIDIIDTAFKIILSDMRVKGNFNLDEKRIIKCITDLENNYSKCLDRFSKEAFFFEFKHIYENYFPKKYEETQVFLEDERKKKKNKIINHIDYFLDAQSLIIFKRTKGRKVLHLNKPVIKNNLIETFEEQLENENILDKKQYNNLFKILLSKRYDDFISSIEKNLAKSYRREEQNLKPSHRNYKDISREDKILKTLLIIFIIPPIIYMGWSLITVSQMPLIESLELYSKTRGLELVMGLLMVGAFFVFGLLLIPSNPES